MANESSANGVSSHLSSTLSLLQCAFPDGLEGKVYPSVLVVLGESMSMRNLADVVAAFTGKEWSYVYNDVLRVLSPTGAPTPYDLEEVRKLLLPCGYNEWLREDG